MRVLLPAKPHAILDLAETRIFDRNRQKSKTEQKVGQTLFFNKTNNIILITNSIKYEECSFNGLEVM